MTQGFKGSYASVRDHIIRRLPLGKKNGANDSSLAGTPLTSRQAVFLFLARPEQLEAEEQEAVQKLRQSHPEADLAYDLIQQFTQMLRTRPGEHLEAWLTKVVDSQISELCAMSRMIVSLVQPGGIR